MCQVETMSAASLFAPGTYKIGNQYMPPAIAVDSLTAPVVNCQQINAENPLVVAVNGGTYGGLKVLSSNGIANLSLEVVGQPNTGYTISNSENIGVLLNTDSLMVQGYQVGQIPVPCLEIAQDGSGIGIPGMATVVAETPSIMLRDENVAYVLQKRQDNHLVVVNQQADGTFPKTVMDINAASGVVFGPTGEFSVAGGFVLSIAGNNPQNGRVYDTVYNPPPVPHLYTAITGTLTADATPLQLSAPLQPGVVNFITVNNSAGTGDKTTSIAMPATTGFYQIMLKMANGTVNPTTITFVLKNPDDTEIAGSTVELSNAAGGNQTSRLYYYLCPDGANYSLVLPYTGPA